MKTSDSIDLISAALAKAQSEFTPALKDSTNPHFKSKYADLASVWAVVQGPMSRNGLAIVQSPEEGPERSLQIVTRLCHSSGQYFEGVLTLYPADQRPQTTGSCITYGRRYSAMGMLGIVPDDDDDGNAASRAPEPPPPPAKPNTFDMRNEKHKAAFKTMLKREFPMVPETLYKTIAEVCHGRPADDALLKGLVSSFLAKHDNSATM